jgi:hypothetical protein
MVEQNSETEQTSSHPQNLFQAKFQISSSILFHPGRYFQSLPIKILRKFLTKSVAKINNAPYTDSYIIQ